jgi:hypothetical protein
MSQSRNKKTVPFTCSYHHDGSEWGVTIHAYDWRDAEARCQKLGFLRLDGEVIAVLPAKTGLVARLICCFRNFFRPSD